MTKKKRIKELKIWNEDYAKGISGGNIKGEEPHQDIDFRKYMSPKEDDEKIIKVKTIKRKRKEKKK